MKKFLKIVGAIVVILVGIYFAWWGYAVFKYGQHLPETTIMVGDLEREYSSFAPSNPPAGAMPLLVILQGGSAGPWIFPQQTRFEDLAEAQGFAIAIPVGIISAASRSAVLNNSLRIVSYLGLAMPNFLLALMIMLFATVYFGETLTGLFSSQYRDAPWSWAKFGDLLSHAWLPIFILGWSATAFALQTVRALMSDEIGKLYVTAAEARGVHGRKLLWRYPARHALGPIINSLGFDLNRIFNELPIVALILVLTDAGALLIEALARSNDQQLAGAIIFLLTGSIVTLNFLTDVLLAVIDPRVRKSIVR